MVYVHANQAYRPSRAIGKIDTNTVLRVRGDIPIYRGIERMTPMDIPIRWFYKKVFDGILNVHKKRICDRDEIESQGQEPS
ncbi:hypothetical protein PNOK_0925800 [Pyrrhoderma noxium]|uniref:Uncharacterized protein n=1 Tax=Pyrrhoderma noxium TaxID=2282107 RepID=A0A286U7K6_9AGAM|nr:hypothetical protein PNOK_0925800 [Pyrrhoderma noxium]